MSSCNLLNHGNLLNASSASFFPIDLLYLGKYSFSKVGPKSNYKWAPVAGSSSLLSVNENGKAILRLVAAKRIAAKVIDGLEYIMLHGVKKLSLQTASAIFAIFYVETLCFSKGNKQSEKSLI